MNEQQARGNTLYDEGTACGTRFSSRPRVTKWGKGEHGLALALRASDGPNHRVRGERLRRTKRAQP